MKKIIAIIPARGGSKGIPKKNLKLMNGKPLIQYQIETALNSKQIEDIYVTTDCNIIGETALKLGVKVIKREDDLSNDEATLDPVIIDAFNKTNFEDCIVITLQATSPTLRSETVDNAIKCFKESDYDTMISVKNDPHLTWKDGENNEYTPCYEKRVNRQWLPNSYKETGAFLISNSSNFRNKKRIGSKVTLFEIPQNESIDIDNKLDWVMAESIMTTKKIAYRVDGGNGKGMGHIYRALTIAFENKNHDITLFTTEGTPGVELIKENNYNYILIKDEKDFIEKIKKADYDIIVNDILDTEEKYIKECKEVVNKVINIEDKGPGSHLADGTINALYNSECSLSGPKYYCLRTDFYGIKSHSVDVKKIVLTFGGEDPADLSSRIYNLLKDKNDVDVILGPAYKGSLKPDGKNVFTNIKNMADTVSSYDLAFTSQGRTIYECYALELPTVVLAQNSRELKHNFADESNGIIPLGLHSDVSDDEILNALDKMKENYLSYKRNMSSIDLSKGTNRVLEIIGE